MTGGFEKRKEQKKDSIRHAALELFQKFGFQKVSMSDIATRAGVSQVTIYNHFNSKQELTRDVLKWYSLALFEKYRGIMEGDLPFLEKLEEIVFDKTEVARQFQGEILQQTYMQNDTEMRAFIEELYSKQKKFITDFFEEGIRQGCINPRLSIDTIMYYFEIIRRGLYSMSDNISERTARNPDLLKELIQIITYGLNG